MASPAAATEDYALQGILWSVEEPRAIVNGEVVKVGQRVGSSEVAAIERRRVKLLVNGEERYLSMEKHS